MQEFLKPPKGMRDFLPEDARKKFYIQNICKEVFESYGYQPLQTPIVENFELLAKKSQAGEAIKEEIYYFEDKAKRPLALRFDLTVPLVRVVAANPQLAKPFKRYQISRVFRYDRPQASRYREFTQADADIIGVKNIFAELELFMLSIDIMKRLPIKEFKIKINDREMLEKVALAFEIPESKILEFFRVIDKADKIGWEEVKNELTKLNINSEVIDFLQNATLEKVEELLKSKGLSSEGLERLKKIKDYAKVLKIAEFLEFDLCLARGLDYYTGTVFEIKCENAQWSAAAGGRFDRLIGSISKQDVAAVGISFGIDRIFDILKDRLKLKNEAELFIIAVGDEKIRLEAFKIADKMRKAGIGCEFCLAERGISKNLDYANKRGFKFVIIIGENELKEKKIKVKDMISGKEKEVGLENLAELKELLKV